MASTRKTIEEILSQRELRLLNVVKKSQGWVPSLRLCVEEFGNDDSAWPLNARTSITGTMAAIGRKLEHYRLKNKLNKRGGGRAGIEYKLE